MANTTPLAYNPSLSPIAGTTQVGTLAVGTTQQDYSGNIGGITWWMGSDEDLGYVIAHPMSGNTQPTPLTTNQITLSPTYKGTDIALSNNNQTAHQNFGYQQSVLGTNSIGTTDKVMFSVLCTLIEPLTLSGSHFVGIGYITMNYQGNPYGGFPGNDINSMGYGSDGTIWYNGGVYAGGFQTWTNNDIIDIVINNNISGMWVRVNGGNWNNDPAANPATYTNAFEIIGGPFYPALCPAYEGTMTIQNLPTYNVPNGYTFLGNVIASLGFNRTKDFTDESFVGLAEYVSRKYSTPQTFSSATEASIWLTTNGFWNSYPAPVLYLDAGNPLSYPGTGTVWTDLIGGKQFNLINGPGYDPGNGGKFYFYAPSGQYAECSTSLQSLPTFTTILWHYWDGTNIGSQPCILTEIYPGSTGTINYFIGNLNGVPTEGGYFNGGFQISPQFNLTPNTWYQIVVTCDSNQIVNVYINNTLDSSTPTAGALPLSSQGGIRLMRRWDNPEYWGGYLSQVGIYDKALTSGQISSLWNSSKSRYGY